MQRKRPESNAMWRVKTRQIRRCRAVAGLGMLAFALQLLLPLVHAPSGTGDARAAEPAAHAAHAHHRHGHTADEALPQPSAPGEHGAHECPLCNIGKSLGALLPPQTLLLRLSVETAPLRGVIAAETVSGLDDYRQARPRAPPVPV